VKSSLDSLIFGQVQESIKMSIRDLYRHQIAGQIGEQACSRIVHVQWQVLNQIRHGLQNQIRDHIKNPVPNRTESQP